MERISNLQNDEIMAIEECGECDTYDFVIPETHCFIANGIVVHNSGDLENNADIVLGLWRKDKQGPLMEVNCLKYRDGEAGWTAYLEFDRFCQRFANGQKPEEKDPETRRDYW